MPSTYRAAWGWGFPPRSHPSAPPTQDPQQDAAAAHGVRAGRCPCGELACTWDAKVELVPSGCSVNPEVPGSNGCHWGPSQR